MSAKDSDLSSSQYGYDFVVATTQKSINAAMKDFLSRANEPETVVCYVAEEQSDKPIPIDYETLKEKANGSDPFTIPDGADPATNQDIANLSNARFLTAFKARVGIPAGAQNVPNIVNLNADTAGVGFNMICSEFQIVQYKPGGYAPAQWMNRSQTADAPWIFSSLVDLRFTPDSDFGKLPPVVQREIEFIGGNEFSVQRLIFDLSITGLSTVPTIAGVDSDSNLYNVLETDFLGKYFSAMKQNGEPLLGFAVLPGVSDPSSLMITNLALNVSPYADNLSPQLDTLNYLCAVNGNALPAPANFDWNWIEMSEETQFDGVAAVNRNALAKIFEYQLTGYVKENCFKAEVDVSTEDLLGAKYWWRMTRGQEPNISTPADGATVLSYSYESYANDSAGAFGGDIGQMTLKPQFNLDVAFAGNQITITQRLVVYLRVQKYQTSDDGNVVDRTLTDTYTLSVNENGRLAVTPSSTSSDNSQTPSTNGFLDFFTGVNEIIDDVASWTRNFTKPLFFSIPVSFVQDFIFPGGNTFDFKDVGFSDRQDLVAHIKYINS